MNVFRIPGLTLLESDGMALSVHGTHRPIDITQRQRHRLRVVGQRGGHESEGDMDVPVVKIVDSAGRFNLQPGLGQCRHIRGVVAHKAVGLVVHANQAHQRMLPPGPVPRWGVRQTVRLGPNAQKGSLVTSGTAGGRNAASASAVRTPVVTIEGGQRTWLRTRHELRERRSVSWGRSLARRHHEAMRE